MKVTNPVMFLPQFLIYTFYPSDSESDHEDEDEEDVDTGNQEDHINQN